MGPLTARVILAPGRERSLRSRHPWIYSGAVQEVQGEPGPGEVVELVDSSGDWLAAGYYSPTSKIRVRVGSWEQDLPLDDGCWSARIVRAAARRGAAGEGEGGQARRIVYSESDGLPGLIVDRYGEWLVAQFLSAAAEARRRLTAETLAGLPGVRGIHERSDSYVRALEGLPERTGPLAGAEPPELVEIQESGMSFRVDLRRGHKTGFYLDQRENRRRAASRLAGGRVLNAYAYTGGFGIAAARAGAKRVVNVDSSAEALSLARENVAGNEAAGCEVVCIEADVPGELRRFRDRGESFDAIVLDPPKFARGAAQRDRAARAYKDINLLALKLLVPGGTLWTFSCSGIVDEGLFRKILAGAAVDAGRGTVWVERLTQADDHPTPLTFPEAAYLCGFICRVDP